MAQYYAPWIVDLPEARKWLLDTILMAHFLEKFFFKRSAEKKRFLK